MFWEWVNRIAAVIAIFGFLGFATLTDMTGHWQVLAWSFGICLIVLMYAQSVRILKWSRSLANACFRCRMKIKITEPSPQIPAKGEHFRVQGTYRIKPDTEKIRVFHRANGEYFLQDKILFWPDVHGAKNWYAEVHVVRVAGFTHDIVVARCSDDNLVNLRYFNHVKERTGHHYGIPYLGKGPGFCILAEMPVPFPQTA